MNLYMLRTSVRQNPKCLNPKGTGPQDIPFCTNFPYIHRATCQSTGAVARRQAM